MKSALIIIHGNLTDTSSIQNYSDTADIIICADGGADHALKNTVIPDVVVGDLDSVSENTRKTLEQQDVFFIKYPRKKDFTDAELAVLYALKQNVDKLVICGVLGDRIDHMMANFQYFADIAHEVQLKIVEGGQEIYFVSDTLELKGSIDDELSLIPLKKDAVGVTTKGLQYVLSNGTLKLGSTRGISNVFVEKNVSVILKEGQLMVVHRKTRT